MLVVYSEKKTTFVDCIPLSGLTWRENNILFNEIHDSEEQPLSTCQGFVPTPTLGFTNLEYCVRRDAALVLTSSTERGKKRKKR